MSFQSVARRPLVTALVAFGGLAACASSPGSGSGSGPSLAERAARLHRDAIVVDTHSDTAPRFQGDDWDFGARHPATDSHMDLPRIREGGLDAEFWSIYTGESSVPGEAVRVALERIDAVYRLVARYPQEMGLATTAADIRRLAAEGRFASLMGVEGGHMIDNDLAILRDYYRLGVRYMTLTHSFHTRWADSSGMSSEPLEPLHHGLTAFGEDVVREMNRLGMMVDVSHVSDETFFDVMRVSRAPVIASHSACRAIADHPRNMSDEMLRALAAGGGVVLINFYPAYIDEKANAETKAYFEKWKDELEAIREQAGDDPVARYAAMRAHFAVHPVPQTSLDVLLDHFDHALQVAGPDHVGIGADWDGVPSMPRGMEDVSALPHLTEGLLARGHDEATVRKVLGENLLRVMERVEALSREIAAGS